MSSEDNSKLTRFAMHDTDVKASQSLFSRLFQKERVPSQRTRSQSPITTQNPQNEDLSPSNADGEGQSRFYPIEEYSEPLTPNKKRGARTEMRTLKNVLGRIMTILDKKPSLNEGLRPYKDSDFRQSWMPDSSCKECYDCSSKFTTFLRRHHCRICGQIFCSRCCNQEVPGRIIGFEGGLRACTYCCGVVSDLMDESEDDLGTLRDNLKAQLSDQQTNGADLRGTPGNITPSRRLSASSDSYEGRLSGPRINSIFDVAPTPEPIEVMSHEERQALVKDSMQLKTLFFEMLNPNDGIQLTAKRHILRTYQNCFYGQELLSWLKKSDQASDDSQAMIIGQAMLDAKYVLCLTDNSSIYHGDFTLYQFRELTYAEKQHSLDSSRRASLYEHEEQTWGQDLEQSELIGEFDMSRTFGRSTSTVTSEFKSSSRVNITEMTFDSDSKTNITPYIIVDRSATSYGSNEQIQPSKEDIHSGVPNIPSEADTTSSENQSIEDHQTEIYNQFKCIYKEHLRRLCIQLLERSRLPLKWTDILLELSSNISHFVRPDVRFNKDMMDINPYVHIKKVRSGEPSDSAVTYGVICTKSVIHNKMKNSIRSPRIMLLQSSIEYQRVTNKLSSLDPQILQEKEYLQNCVARICKYKPDVLLVENTVSRVAQQLLLEAGITVIINVKQRVMNRVARLTMADIIPSIDSLISPPQLGTCYRFKTDMYRFHDGYYKTLMVFSGCPANLGCTVMLRSKSYSELVKVKPVLLMLVNAYHHMKLEISYMVDQSALPPSEKHFKDKKRHASSESRESEDSNHLLVQEEGNISGGETSSGSPRMSPRGSKAQVKPESNAQQSEFDVRKFRRILNDIILDYSPFMKVNPPYFETEKGRMSSLRSLFPAQPYWSPLLTGAQLLNDETRTRGNNELYNHRLDPDNIQSLTAELRDPHPFITWGVNCPVTSKPFKDLAAQYRMGGARLVLKSGNFIDQQGASLEDQRQDSLDEILPVVDCFDIIHHQKISVLFSSYTADMGLHPCVKPWIVHMQFYNKNDMTLGHFLELYCFRPGYQCPRSECEISMLEHIRRFVHESGSLYLIVKRVHEVHPKDISPEKSEDRERKKPEHEITTWSWCRKCAVATNVSPLSPSTWHMSFAKFLQLRLTCKLSCSQATPDCVHSISRDYYQYFKYRDLVAVFKYSAITIREVKFPSPQIEIKHKICRADVSSQVQIIHTHGLGLFSSVTESFYKLEAYGLDTQGKKQILKEHKTELEKEKSWFLSEIDRIQTKLLEERLADSTEEQEKITSAPDHQTLHQLEDELLKLKCHLSRAVQQWNIKIDRLTTKEEKSADRKVTRAASEGTTGRKSVWGSDPTSQTLAKNEAILSESDKHQIVSGGSSNSDSKNDALVSSNVDPDGPISSSNVDSARKMTDSSVSSLGSNQDVSALQSADYDLAHYHQIVNTGLRAGVRRSRTIQSEDSTGSFDVCGNTPESSKSPISPGTNSSIMDDIHSEHTSSSKEDVVTPLAHTPNSNIDQQDDIFNPQCTDSDEPIAEGDGKTDEGVVTTENDCIDMVSVPAEDNSQEVTERPHKKKTTFAAGEEARISQRDAWVGDLTEPASNGIVDTAKLQEAASTLPGVDSDHFKNKQGDDVDTSSVKMRFAPVATVATTALRSKRQAQVKKSQSRILIDTFKTAILPSTEESHIPPVENPFSDDEHYLLWPTLHVPIVVYDEEPSSIIAYTLGSSAYEDSLIEAKKQLMLEKISVGSGSSVSLPDKAEGVKQQKRDEIEIVLQLTSISSITAAMRSRNSSPLTPLSSGYTSPARSDTPPVNNQTLQSARVSTYAQVASFTSYLPGAQGERAANTDDVDQFRFGKPKDRSDTTMAIQHLEMPFTEKSVSGERTALIFCKVYFAIEFKKLRKLIFPEGENEFIRSLSRCFKWHAKGGKSGLTFCKTKDERFIMKQMSKAEMQSFLVFGPPYFQYVTKSFSDQQSKKRCALARILGVYTIRLKNFLTNAIFEQDVLIIENVFYGHKINKTFDLKGSDRNRLVKKESFADVVLLDENFMKYSKHNPIYMQAHTKKVIMETLDADSKFLADLTVMDYSLLCGYDEHTKELVVGIIDYIRTFTWDKRLETAVKSSLPKSKMPTIVSPKVYQNRFIEAMDRYFNVVPTRWTGLANADC